MQNLNKIVTITLAVLTLIAVGYLIVNWNSSPTPTTTNITAPMNMPIESFSNEGAPAEQVSVQSGFQMPSQPQQMVDASESIEFIAQPQSLNTQNTGSQLNQLPSECYPKDVLSSADLLPRDANSLWAQVNPSGQGSLADQNFLTAGFHIGINTVGQTLRNANRQLRSEPLNPQVKVSPWLQTTIEPDINRRPLEIQGDL
jgi:hypothetical protein